MFCLKQMSEVDMFSHVFYGHNISGMFFSSAGGGEGGETVLTSTNTVSVQTEESPPPSPQRLEPTHRVSDSLDLQRNIEQTEISSNNKEELVAASEGFHIELHGTEEEEQTNPGCDEENLILLDDDESDFEMDGPLPEVYCPSDSFKADDSLHDSPTSQPEHSQPED